MISAYSPLFNNWNTSCLTAWVRMTGLSMLLISMFSASPVLAAPTPATTTNIDSAAPIVGGVDTKDQAALSQSMNSLLTSALNKNVSFQKSDKAVRKYHTIKFKAWSKIKNASNSTIPWHGSGPSSEAGDVILGEKVKIKSLDSAEYARQAQFDQTRLALVGTMLEFAKHSGLGETADSDAARAALEKLTSPAETAVLEQSIKFLDTSGVTADMLHHETFTSSADKRQRRKQLADKFIETDPGIREITRHIHRYNHLSGARRFGDHVIQTVLGLTSMMPDTVAPVSEVAMMVYDTLRGGTEEEKLMKELYLERRLQSRRQTLTDLAEIVMDSYEDAAKMGNLRLAIFAKSLMTEYGDAETTESVLKPNLNNLELVQRNINGPAQ